MNGRPGSGLHTELFLLLALIALGRALWSALGTAPWTGPGHSAHWTTAAAQIAVSTAM
jgi:hypothetical protein